MCFCQFMGFFYFVFPIEIINYFDTFRNPFKKALSISIII